MHQGDAVTIPGPLSSTEIEVVVLLMTACVVLSTC